MSKLLYIESSPRKKRSSSIVIANFFLEEYQKAHPQDTLSPLDLWKKELPPFDGDVIDAKYAIMHGKPHTDAQVKAWKKVEELIDEFKSADKYVISLPMWNFGIPYKLKHYIDLLVQPGYAFAATPEGYKGLITNRKVLLIYSRGGEYGVEAGGQELDLQKRYMETILRFIGFEKFESIVIEPTLAGDEKKDKSINEAKQKIPKLAAEF